MALSNQPLEERLSKILPERVASSEPDEPITAFEPAETGDDNVVQVAGLRDIVIGGAKLVREGQAAKKAIQAPVEPNPTALPPGTTAAPPAPGTALPQVSAPQPKIGDLPQQLQKIEATIEQAPVAGAPPETLINLNRIDGPADFKQTVESLAQSSGLQVERLTWEQTLAEAKRKGFEGNLLGDL